MIVDVPDPDVAIFVSQRVPLTVGAETESLGINFARMHGILERHGLIVTDGVKRDTAARQQHGQPAAIVMPGDFFQGRRIKDLRSLP